MMPLSLYIHIPWCVRKCPYCDFNSHQQKNELPESEYVQRLLQDLEYDLRHFDIDTNQRKIHSIFFGGGTPSLFLSDSIGRIIDGVNDRIQLETGCEITLEANPGTFEAEKFAGFRQAGVNRLSIGIQSFNDEHLKKLGRIHNADEAKKAITTAFDSGFENINLDLMYALPEQTYDQALSDVEMALSFPVTHLSHYQLTLEPNTLFAKFPPKLPDDDSAWAIQDACQKLIAENRFKQYEVSAYSKLDKQCQHNLNYWRFGDYLGIGAGAHGKITDTRGSVHRTAKPRHPKQYLDNALGDDFIHATKVTASNLAFEYFLNRLRLQERFSLQEFAQMTGLDSDTVIEKIDTAKSREWLRVADSSIRVTPLGQQFLNDLQALFLP